MRKLKIPRAAWTTATGEKLKEAEAQFNAEEIDLQLLADSLAPGESVQIAPDVWFSMTIELQFDPDPAPEGWQEEFGRAHVHPRTGEILFHRAFFEGPDSSWQTLGNKEALIALSDALKAYPHLRPSITTLAFRAWRLTSVHPSPDIMNEEVGAPGNFTLGEGRRGRHEQTRVRCRTKLERTESSEAGY
jgi:hypothetical protein